MTGANPSDPTLLYRVRDGSYAADLLIAAVVSIDVFTWLDHRGRVRAHDLAKELGLADRPVDVLLTYCASLGLIERYVEAGDEVEITEFGRDHLVAGSPFDLRAYYQSIAERPGVLELYEVLRSDQQAAWSSAQSNLDRQKADEQTAIGWSGRLADGEFARGFTAAMDARGAYLGPALAAATSHLPFARLLDVGGSSGVYAFALVDRRPDATATVFERSPVDAAARTLIRERGWEKRVTVVTGDMFVDPLPLGYDAHLYSQVLHDWDRARVEYLLESSFSALQPGGWLIEHDTHIDRDKRGPRAVAEYSVLLMHSTPGKCWSVGELTEMTTGVGFVDITHAPTAGDRSVLLARKPQAI